MGLADDEAPDAVQETMLRLWRELDSGTEIADPEPGRSGRCTAWPSIRTASDGAWPLVERIGGGLGAAGGRHTSR